MKEIVATGEMLREQNIAKSLLVLNNYQWLKNKAEDLGINIIPIKGIDLLKTIYSDSLERPVCDIDIFIADEEKALQFCTFLCQDDYRPEFPFSLRREVLNSKHKISLIACCRGKVNVDIHTALVTKKFFSKTINGFNSDAANRCDINGMEIKDKWLFLAQHAAFHNWSNPKWIEDLHIIYKDFTQAERKQLKSMAEYYGLRRIYLATIEVLHDVITKEYHVTDCINRNDRNFLKYIRKNRRPFKRNISDRIITAYWEFNFITDKRQRQKMLLKLLWPEKGVLANIYRIKKASSLWFYYPLNLIISIVTGLIFRIDYNRRILF